MATGSQSFPICKDNLKSAHVACVFAELYVVFDDGRWRRRQAATAIRHYANRSLFAYASYHFANKRISTLFHRFKIDGKNFLMNISSLSFCLSLAIWTIWTNSAAVDGANERNKMVCECECRSMSCALQSSCHLYACVTSYSTASAAAAIIADFDVNKLNYFGNLGSHVCVSVCVHSVQWHYFFAVLIPSIMNLKKNETFAVYVRRIYWEQRHSVVVHIRSARSGNWRQKKKIKLVSFGTLRLFRFSHSITRSFFTWIHFFVRFVSFGCFLDSILFGFDFDDDDARRKNVLEFTARECRTNWSESNKHWISTRNFWKTRNEWTKSDPYAH